MIPCAFYPVTADTIPVVRQINRYADEKRIVTLISFPGSGLAGKDGGYADCGCEVGIKVQERIEYESSMWECLIVAFFGDHDQEELSERQSHTVRMIDYALSMKKQVVCAQGLSEENLEYFRNKARNEKCDFCYLPIDTIKTAPRFDGATKAIHSFCVLFGNVVQDSASFEAFLQCSSELSKTFPIISISTDDNAMLCGFNSVSHILRSGISETQKIYQINRLVAGASERERPELVLIHISNAMLAYNDSVPNGFGVIPFMFSKAVPTHCFICTIPFALSFPDFVEELSKGIENQNGYPVEGIVVSNMLIDSPAVFESESISATYAPISTIEETLQYYTNNGETPAFCITNQTNIDKLVALLVDGLNQFKLSSTIP